MFGRRQETCITAGDCFQAQGKRKRQVERKSRFEELAAKDEVWTRTVRMRTDTQHIRDGMIEADHFIEDTMRHSTNSENFSPLSVSSNRENNLASTHRWRNLLLSNESQDSPLVSEEIFRENVNVLLNGIDKCAGNPALWSRECTNSFFDTIRRFLNSWKRQLMAEKEKIDLEALLLKGKFENKHDLLTNRLNMLTGVFQESMTFMEFSELQKKAMQAQVNELNGVRGRFGESGRLVLSESSLATELKNKNRELIEARKQADGYWEELRRIQSGLKETNLIQMKTALRKFSEFQRQSMTTEAPVLNDFRGILKETGQLVKSELSLASDLKNKDFELSEARKRADEYLEELRKTQDSLKAHLKLKDVTNLLHTNNRLTQEDQQVMVNKCLQDKEKQLQELKKQLDCGVKKQTETENKLRETREQLQIFVARNAEINLMTLNRQTDMNKKLSEIQTLLLMKNPEFKPNCRIESDGLNKEEKILRDIKALIEYDLQSVKSALETNSGPGFLKVSEYEIHLVTLIATCLKVTPFPVNSKYIYSYVANIDNAVDLKFVENLLRKFPSFFKEVAVAPGSRDKNWSYLDLKPVITI